MLAKTSRLFGKAPVASHEELAEKTAAAEPEADDEDESYVDDEEGIPNDDFEYVKATTPLAVPWSKPSMRKKKDSILIKIAVAFEVLLTCPRYANANEMNNEYVEVNDIRKRRRRCKVCTIRKTVTNKRQVTRFYCPWCCKGSNL
ncbi:uncharacterized protein IUM83_10733 [Phytophthora cinnamomi]|uniref:uncharacterized protein n=1 Tax=Phytophthora cinnamomi TaxID=4785 RepID=UPI0035595FFB|nr:hypothetical protein IUM83_10733 [Phytophthora cinnamomi]